MHSFKRNWVITCSMIFILLISTKSFAQTEHPEKKMILEKVNQFFQALETQDTFLLKSIVLLDGQTLSISTTAEAESIRIRAFKDRLKSFSDPNRVIHEKMLSAEIKIHGKIAMAWVPYTLSINDKFDHCGIDVFTLFKTKDGWKINTLAFSQEPDVCPERK